MAYALVFGRARSVWDEMVAFRSSFAPCGDEVVIGVGRAGQDYPGRLDHWVSFHAELFTKWSTRRRHLNFPSVCCYWTAYAKGRVRFESCLGHKINHVECVGGSSGLIGVRVAQALGLNKIVLCGIPMEPDAAHYDVRERWDEALVHRSSWEKAAAELAPVVRSMSGWTMNLFGSPTKDWLSS